jgi:isochorismate synthase
VTAVPATGRLVARTRQLADGAAVDLVAVAGESGTLWARGDLGFAGRGVACTIEVPPGDPAAAAATVHRTLQAIDCLDAGPGGQSGPGRADEPGRGPVALGALPFDPRLSGTLVVPSLLVGRTADGATWVTTVGPASDVDPIGAADPVDVAALRAVDDVAATPTRYTVTSSRAPEDWCRSVVAARDELRAGVARKVVLAREVVIDTDQPLSRRALLEQLRRSYPAAMLFAADGFVGASPELLVERMGDRVRSHPMAGTAPRSGDPTVDARLAADLLASGKDQIEHRFTIDMVHDTLLPWCSYLDEEAAPSIVAMANVQHLATLVEGRLSSPAASVIELMRALHPTPAVNGAPREVALDLIGRHEGLDRGRYGGPVGWVDAAGNGAWTVGIRSAELSGTRARLFAGVGVVADSDPAAELAETRAKFEALLNAILRP